MLLIAVQPPFLTVRWKPLSFFVLPCYKSVCIASASSPCLPRLPRVSKGPSRGASKGSLFLPNLELLLPASLYLLSSTVLPLEHSFIPRREGQLQSLHSLPHSFPPAPSFEGLQRKRALTGQSFTPSSIPSSTFNFRRSTRFLQGVLPSEHLQLQSSHSLPHSLPSERGGHVAPKPSDLQTLVSPPPPTLFAKNIKTKDLIPGGLRRISF